MDKATRATFSCHLTAIYLCEDPKKPSYTGVKLFNSLARRHQTMQRHLQENLAVVAVALDVL